MDDQHYRCVGVTMKSQSSKQTDQYSFSTLLKVKDLKKCWPKVLSRTNNKEVRWCQSTTALASVCDRAPRNTLKPKEKIFVLSQHKYNVTLIRHKTKPHRKITAAKVRWLITLLNLQTHIKKLEIERSNWLVCIAKWKQKKVYRCHRETEWQRSIFVVCNKSLHQDTMIGR